MLRVMRKHRAALKDIDRTHVPEGSARGAPRRCGTRCIELGEQHGFRNAQATVLAPTGTIGFMMDCDTTGVEPDIALVKYKKLVGGGMMKIVNHTVPMALKKLGYTRAADQGDHRATSTSTRRSRARRTSRSSTCAVFDCAFKPAHGVRSIHYMGHVRMMGAVQPFLSGAISKTVNVPKDATVEDIEQAYIDAWRIGAKAVVDLPRRLQAHAAAQHVEATRRRRGARRPSTPPARAGASCRTSATRSRTSSTSPATRATSPSASTRTARRARSSSSMAKEGSTISGFADAFAQAISYALQYGVPLQDLVDKFSHVRFEPSGMTKNPDIRFAKSIVDYIFRWMAAKFLSPEAQFRAGVNNREEIVDARRSSCRSTSQRRRRTAAAASGPSGRLVVRGDSEPGRRAALLDVRVDHGAQRRLLQVRELRHHLGVRVASRDPGFRSAASAVEGSYRGPAQAGPFVCSTQSF